MAIRVSSSSIADLQTIDYLRYRSLVTRNTQQMVQYNTRTHGARRLSNEKKKKKKERTGDATD